MVYIPRKVTSGKRPKRKVASNSTVATSKAITKIVNKVVGKAAEKKIVIYQQNAPITGLPTSNSIFPITPYNGYLTIPQGVAQAQRVGNRIKVSKATLRYVLYPAPYHLTTNNQPQPKDVRIWFFKNRNDQTLQTANMNQFVQTGDSSINLSGYIIDLNRVVNDDRYISHGHVTHKVGNAYYLSEGVSAINQQGTNNDYKLNVIKVMDITKMYPKTIVYNDTDNNPLSNLVQMAIQAVNADGTIVDPVNVTIRCQFQITLEYTDV